MIRTGSAGDPSQGRAVFSRACQQCHTLFGVGGQVGPDITGSNRADLDYILHNILDPNAEIPNDYRTSILSTTDERVISGIVRRQDESSVTMATANDLVTVPRDEIESLYQSELSMMPEGLADALSEKEVRDLIAYLRSPGQVPTEDTSANVDGN
jgi:putative heme-binding domain-containing protein